MPGERERRRRANVERVLSFRSFPGLASVDPTTLASLADLATERTFPGGATLIEPGGRVRAMHLIRSGTVAVLREGRTLRRFGAGDFVGAIASLTREAVGQQVVAETEVRTFEIDSREFLDVLEDSFSLLHAALIGILRSVLGARKSIFPDAGFAEPPPVKRPDAELGLAERVLFVRRLLTYGHAGVEAVAELAREMRALRIPEGQVLWEAGDHAPHALLVWSGSVGCTTPPGQTFRFGPDSVVGGIDSIAGEPRWYRAVAETDLLVLKSGAAELLDVLEDHPDMGLSMLRGAARILSELNERVEPAE